MTHGHSHAEEAEHASHHAQNPFDKRVALTMVIIAAVLAAVKVLGHRAHNTTLQLQIQAGVEHTKADTAHTQESDEWNFFQAQKIRQHMYELQADMLDLNIKENKLSAAAGTKLDAWKKRAEDYKNKAEDLKKKAEKRKEEGEEYNARAARLETQSEHMHHRCDYFDWGEMGIEIGLVLCSLAILVRLALFWYAGMAVAAVGVLVASLGLLPDKHEASHQSKPHAVLSRPGTTWEGL